MSDSAHYATKRKRRLCYASQLPNPRLESQVERVRGSFFSASVMVCIDGEILVG
jgi:hypothetical protein